MRVDAVAFCGALTTAVAASASAPTPKADMFAQACDQRLTAVQANLRVCFVGVVTGKDSVQVLHATAPALLGRTVRLYQSSGVMSASRPISDLRALMGRMVVVGGQWNGESLYNARLL